MRVAIAIEDEDRWGGHVPNRMGLVIYTRIEYLDI